MAGSSSKFFYFPTKSNRPVLVMVGALQPERPPTYPNTHIRKHFLSDNPPSPKFPPPQKQNYQPPPQKKNTRIREVFVFHGFCSKKNPTSPLHHHQLVQHSRATFWIDRSGQADPTKLASWPFGVSIRRSFPVGSLELPNRPQAIWNDMSFKASLSKGWIPVDFFWNKFSVGENWKKNYLKQPPRSCCVLFRCFFLKRWRGIMEMMEMRPRPSFERKMLENCLVCFIVVLHVLWGLCFSEPLGRILPFFVGRFCFLLFTPSGK